MAKHLLCSTVTLLHEVLEHLDNGHVSSGCRKLSLKQKEDRRVAGSILRGPKQAKTTKKRALGEREVIDIQLFSHWGPALLQEVLVGEGVVEL